jgi:aminoglycoside phosphotransferase
MQIPQEHQTSVSRALQTAFGVTETEELQPITKGQSGAFIARLTIQGSPYLLRIARKNAYIGAEREFTCLQAAADAGLAPRVYYTNLDDRLSISDFVNEVPLSDPLIRMPAILRALHALPSFPKVLPGFDTTCMSLLSTGPTMDRFFKSVRDSDCLPEPELNQLFEWKDQLVAAYHPDEADRVPCHNDLFKPDNVLFDGDRLWFVDWEAAFQNDRYADLAVVANQVVTNESEEFEFLTRYLGHAPADEQRYRLKLVRQLARVFYAAVFLMLGATSQPDKRVQGQAYWHHLQRTMSNFFTL